MKRNLFVFLLAILVFWIFQSFILPVAMGAVLAVLLFPIQERITRSKIPNGIGALCLMLFATFGFLLPIALSVFLITQTILEWAQGSRLENGLQSDSLMQSLIESVWFQRLAGSLERWFSIDLGSLIDEIQKIAQMILKKAAEIGADFLTQIPSLTLALVIVLASMFFVLMDSRRLVEFFRRNSVFNISQTVAIQSHFVGLCRSVVLASVLSGLAQAIILLGFLLSLSIPKAFTWAMLVFLTSFIPLVGSAPISVGLMLFAFLQGQTTTGIVLAIAVVIVAAADNIIRPAVLKGGGDMHPLLGFLSALGGIQVMGFWGIFLGPVIVGTFLTALDLVLSESD